MDLRSLNTLDHGERLEADICIIGTGPAGATLMRELAGTRLRVIVVESGETDPVSFADGLNEIENIGVARTLDQRIVRNRILGGTSLLWNGRCAYFDEVDYRDRPWVPHSGWPLGPEEMAPYFARSADQLGLGLSGDFSHEGFWELAGRARPTSRLNAKQLRPFFWQFSRVRDPQEPMRFGPRILSERSTPNLRVLTGATAVHINTNEAATVQHSLEVAAHDDRRWTIKAGRLVLCAGGIENARLLLNSTRVCPGGLGNTHDMVGRFLMDHPRGGVAKFDHKKARTLEPHFGFHTVHAADGTNLFCQGLRLSPDVQESEGLLNCAVWLSELVAPDDPWTAIKRMASGRARWARDPLAVLSNGVLMARGLDSMLRRGGGPIRKLDGLELNCIVEQLPDPDSRVLLAERVDSHGMRLPRLDWRISELERHTVRRTAQLVAGALQDVGIAPPVLEQWAAAGEGFGPGFGDVAHHIGTTRMAASARSGVVDATCQVHGVRGLFVAGSSVFPTASHANPTQMIVALAIRLADHLKADASAAIPALMPVDCHSLSRHAPERPSRARLPRFGAHRQGEPRRSDADASRR